MSPRHPTSGTGPDIGDSSQEPQLWVSAPKAPTFEDNTEPYAWLVQIEQVLLGVEREERKVLIALQCFREGRALSSRRFTPPPTTWTEFKRLFLKTFVDNGEEVLPGIRLVNHLSTIKVLTEPNLALLERLAENAGLEEQTAVRTILRHLSPSLFPRARSTLAKTYEELRISLS